MLLIRFTLKAILFMFVFSQTYPWLASVATQYFSSSLKKDVELDYLAYVYALESARPSLSENQWYELLDEISSKTNLKIKSLPSDEDITTEPRIKVEHIHDEHLQTITAKILDKELIQLSALDVDENAEFILTLIQFILPLGLIILIFFFYTLWLQYRLRKLENASQLIANGDLSIRVDTGFKAVGRVNQTFNHMADKLQLMFHRQRSLLRAISHELKTPLFRLQLKLDLIDLDELPANTQQQIKSLLKDCDEMESLIFEILEFSKHESLSTPPELFTVNLSELIGNQVQTLRQHCDKPISLYCEPLIYISASEIGIQRVINNLVFNADQYAAQHISVSLNQCERVIYLIVEDDGVGIPEEKRALIFQPFYRLDESRSKETGGVGLGLAIVQEILHQHQASIAVERSQWGGARFVIQFTDHRALSATNNRQKQTKQ
ncbi:ATP-binding protein [Photobacterium sp. 1_MG-2023]|uniref:ATP-binding protein n=1 Tax=Photobacterium sp. 1_MG-2023 TaxID=3062646 RepID=UPI0026E4949D|nr:ATP-binding protein [Photobacterium sp. 1_MG-2023]MDO6707573.1 ATP-binding protein [Photobacterium sp. 1_MG-2023]